MNNTTIYGQWQPEHNSRTIPALWIISTMAQLFRRRPFPSPCSQCFHCDGCDCYGIPQGLCLLLLLAHCFAHKYACCSTFCFCSAHNVLHSPNHSFTPALITDNWALTTKPWHKNWQNYTIIVLLCHSLIIPFHEEELVCETKYLWSPASPHNC